MTSFHHKEPNHLNGVISSNEGEMGEADNTNE